MAKLKLLTIEGGDVSIATFDPAKGPNGGLDDDFVAAISNEEIILIKAEVVHGNIEFRKACVDNDSDHNDNDHFVIVDWELI